MKLRTPLGLILLAATLSVSCGKKENASFSDDQLLNTGALIGGVEAKSTEYQSTVRVNRSCTGSKVGPKLFLLAAHCIVDKNNGGVRSTYKSGSRIRLETHTGVNKMVTIDQSYPHGSYTDVLNERRRRRASTSGIALEAYDIALFKIKEETPRIAAAVMNTDPVKAGDALVIGGYGCEVRVGGPRARVSRLKVYITKAVADDGTEDHFGRNSTRSFDYNIYTPGKKHDLIGASICPGDSGGPVYLANKKHDSYQVVGVNSQYLFTDSSGKSYVNLHARTSGVSRWIRRVQD